MKMESTMFTRSQYKEIFMKLTNLPRLHLLSTQCKFKVMRTKSQQHSLYYYWQGSKKKSSDKSNSAVTPLCDLSLYTFKKTQ